MTSAPTTLLVDWGGVLTGPLSTAIEKWAEADRVDLEAYFDLVNYWLGPEFSRLAHTNPIHALEVGALTIEDFEGTLKREMETRTGRHFPGPGMVARMFAMFDHAPDMNGLVYRARRCGVRTGLISNSWGNEYPRDGWNDMFECVVISHEVGLRKPDPAIFELAISTLGVSAGECVFVDDLHTNVAAAVEFGMIGVHHTSYDSTLMELNAIFDANFGDDPFPQQVHDEPRS